MPAEPDWLLDLLRCPDDGAALDGAGACTRCGRSFRAGDDETFLRMLPHAGESAQDVRGFYEEQPFPDYEDMDSPRQLRARARRSGFAASLDQSLPLDGVVVEAGCGTGQLGNFLALSRRRVIGLDFTAASLRLATGFRDRYAIDHARFVQADLFAPPLQEASVAAVVSLGVLHHTPDPHGAFRALVPLLEPGGWFVLGLYNKIGRLPTHLRRLLIKPFGMALGARLDPVARTDRSSQKRKFAWLRDQYLHPLERTHSVDEVLAWFDQAGLEFVHAVPGIALGEVRSADDDVLQPSLRGTRFDHLLRQTGWIFSHGWEGALFVLVGRRVG